MNYADDFNAAFDRLKVNDVAAESVSPQFSETPRLPALANFGLTCEYPKECINLVDPVERSAKIVLCNKPDDLLEILVSLGRANYVRHL